MKKRPRKILLVANTGWYLYNFRLTLANGMRREGIEPVFVSPRDSFSEKLVAQGFTWREWNLKRASLNPLSALGDVYRLIQIYRSERPQAVHHFTPKCVFFGTIAAEICRIKAIVNSVTGLGHLAEDKRLRYRVIFAVEKMFYGMALGRKRVKVILQNPDDMAELTRLGLLRGANCQMIRGSGVDTTRFQPRANAVETGPVILFASRLLEAKGIYELLEAARAVKAALPNARILVAGDADPGNPTAVPLETLELWKKEGAVELLGLQDPIDNWIAESAIVVLPSYREGLPKILLEASAMGKAVVATDVPGCREVVAHGITGLLVPVRNGKALAEALLTLLNDPQLRAKMGAAGRKKVVEEFSADQVISETVGVYNSLALEAIA